MGFASYLEDVQDRYFESAIDWGGYPGRAAQRRDVEEARGLFGDPMDRPRRIIRDFWTYYRFHQGAATLPEGRAEEHFRNVQGIHAILASVEQIDPADPGSWPAVRAVEERLRDFFRAARTYGPLSRTVVERVVDLSRAVHARCGEVVRELNRFNKSARALPVEERERLEVSEALRQLHEIKDRLSGDLKQLNGHQALAKEAHRHWETFLRLYTTLAVQHRYRPALQHLDRFQLNDAQERFVALDHQGGYRIQGASGSGKTVILIHRALRLAGENPSRQVRVFTVNRALADLLRSSIGAVNGSVPGNLHVAAFYDFLVAAVGLFDRTRECRLVDERSGERINLAWRDFFHHRGRDAGRNVFAEADVAALVESLRRRDGGRLDAARYLRDEMVYVQSAYTSPDRGRYLAELRRTRGVVFQPQQKEASLKVVRAWEEWLRVGHLCDVDGLTLLAADLLADPGRLGRVRQTLPTDFVLVDEVQDFSTLELELVRAAVAEPEGPNRFFLVGDLNQKVYPKHHDSRRAGFNFRGRAGVLRQNYRNTREILRAAYNLPQAFPPREEEEDAAEVVHPELSPYAGGRPVALGCTPGDHLARVLDVVRSRRGRRVAVVSENEGLLGQVRAEAARMGCRCHELLRNEDLDLWREQGDALAADLAVARLEAVKGFEFDTVVVCDLSRGVMPREGTPEEEHWREAAVVYAALTRARDELVITYVGEPSRFLKAMLEDIDLLEAPAEDRVLRALAMR